MSKKNDKKWKSALLKTSLPLEYLIAEKLSKLKCGIQGEYHYLRPNEQGIQSEFSVDIWAVSSLIKKNAGMWANLNYLIECKYCHPSVKWIFAPHTKTDAEHLFEISIVHALDRLCTKQLWNKKPIWGLIKQFPLCFKGVEIHSNDATTQNIERGRFQLRYGTTRLAIHLSETQMMSFHDEELYLEFICPILVTTADLYIIDQGLSIDDFKNASSPENISSKVPALILTNPYSHLFAEYSDKLLSDLHKKKPEIKSRLEQLKKLINKISRESKDTSKISESLWFDWDMREVSQRLLVVNYNEFESILKKVRQAVVKAGKSLTRVGILENDLSKYKKWVSEYTNVEDK